MLQEIHKTLRRFGSVLLLAGVVAGATTAARADGNLIVNGSFELPATTGANFTTPTGWTATGTAPAVVVYRGASNFTPVAEDGNQAVLLATDLYSLTLAQSVTLMAGTTYELDFAWAGSPSYYRGNPPNLTMSLTGGTDNFTQTYTNNASPTTWTDLIYTFTATSTGAYTLAFFSPQGSMNALDNVSLTATTAVPEPATVALLTGAAALGLVAVRRRQQAA